MSANLIYADDLYKAATDADAVVILTEWKEFASVDLIGFARLFVSRLWWMGGICLSHSRCRITVLPVSALADSLLILRARLPSSLFSYFE
jgi:hypothetical protein